MTWFEAGYHIGNLRDFTSNHFHPIQQKCSSATRKHVKNFNLYWSHLHMLILRDSRWHYYFVASAVCGSKLRSDNNRFSLNRSSGLQRFGCIPSRWHGPRIDNTHQSLPFIKHQLFVGPRHHHPFADFDHHQSSHLICHLSRIVNSRHQPIIITHHYRHSSWWILGQQQILIIHTTSPIIVNHQSINHQSSNKSSVDYQKNFSYHWSSSTIIHHKHIAAIVKTFLKHHKSSSGCRQIHQQSSAAIVSRRQSWIFNHKPWSAPITVHTKHKPRGQSSTKRNDQCNDPALWIDWTTPIDTTPEW